MGQECIDIRMEGGSNSKLELAWKALKAARECELHWSAMWGKRHGNESIRAHNVGNVADTRTCREDFGGTYGQTLGYR